MKDWTGNKATTFVQLGASNHSETERETNDFYDVPSYKGRLKINREGEVYSLLSNKILKTSTLPNGYTTIILMLKKPRRTKTLYLHRLLAETFIPNPEHKATVNHKNGIKADNRIENLEWCTQRENNIHALQHNLRKPNVDKILEINKTKRKLTTKQAKFVRENKHLKTKELCEKLGLNYNKFRYCVYDVKRGRSFKHD